MVSVYTKECDNLCFQSVNVNMQGVIGEERNIFDSFIFDENIQINLEEYEKNYLTPRAEYERIQKEQGTIGKLINKIKNNNEILGAIGLFGSNYVEAKLEEYENEEIKEYEIRELLKQYEKNQRNIKEIVINLISIIVIMVSGIIGFTLELDMQKCTVISVLLGGIVRIILEKYERRIDEKN